jgi:endonuclease/exonuclease/phosphatase family metal-dependent hydrolase
VPRAPSVARIGSWNLHWFPDGKPGRGEDGEGTDLPWLACAITFLDLDVLAAQEVKGTRRAREALSTLVSLLDRSTGGSWQVTVDDCPESSGQHVAVLYDSKRARRLGGATLAALNPHGEACKDQLRPGLDAYLGFRGGLDLHVVSVHLKAGGKARDIALRQRSFESFSEAFAAAQLTAPDRDVLVLGDLNTMGCPDCSPPKSSTAELAELGPLLAREGFRKLESDLACSFHFQGAGTLLDGAGVSSGFLEAEGVTLRVGGPCAELGCERAPERHPARSALSDHCPVYVDLPDRDLD